MRLRRLALRGLTRFTAAEPVSIDLDALGPGLVALVGANGAGKTTILEAVTAALYKTFPSRPGHLHDHAYGRDAFVEADFEDGAAQLRARVQVDAERRTTEAYLFLNGQPLTTGRAAEYSSEIERRFGSLELLLSSVFAAQNRAGNFLLMTRGDRKALFGELLGLGHLEALHLAARERRDRAEGALEGARAELARLEAEISGKAQTEAALEEARLKQEGAAGVLATAREEEAAATSALERVRAAAGRLAALRSAATSANQAVDEAERAVREAASRKTTAEQTARQRRSAAVQASIDCEMAERSANAHHAEAMQRIAVRQRQTEKALEERPALEAARKRVEDLERELVALEAAEKDLRAAEGEVKVAEGAAIAANRRVADARARLADEQKRLATEAKLLDQVPCTGQEVWYPAPYGLDGDGEDLAGSCQLLKAARDAKARGPELHVAPILIEDARVAQERHEAAHEAYAAAAFACDPVRLAEIRTELPVVRAQTARLPALEQARKELEGLAGDLERANKTRSDELKAAATRQEQILEERTAIEADLAAAIADANTKQRAAEERLAAARRRADEAGQALAAAGQDPLTLTQAEANLSACRQVRYEDERALREVDKAHASLEARLDAIRAVEAELPAAREALAAAEQDLGAWRLLEQALGRDGVQALEIDAAGPEVARLTNELLDSCYGPRFRISFETLREKKSKAGEYAEAFEVRVFDNGHARPVEALSGGERVVVGEAVGLGIAIFNARKNSVRWETVFRDETAGALDPVNGARYVDMLRRALALGGFANIVYVAHQPELWERADARLLVTDGRVTVEGAAAGVPAGAAA